MAAGSNPAGPTSPAKALSDGGLFYLFTLNFCGLRRASPTKKKGYSNVSLFLLLP
jgi:hypothetical protein